MRRFGPISSLRKSHFFQPCPLHGPLAGSGPRNSVKHIPQSASGTPCVVQSDESLSILFRTFQTNSNSNSKNCRACCAVLRMVHILQNVKPTAREGGELESLTPASLGQCTGLQSQRTRNPQRINSNPFYRSRHAINHETIRTHSAAFALRR